LIAATVPDRQRRRAKLLHMDLHGRVRHLHKSNLIDLLRRGDVVVANDAATIPASLHGTHSRTGLPIEIRLAGRASLAADDVKTFVAVVFGDGDFHVRTEDRPLPPPLQAGDELVLGPLCAVIVETLEHPRLVRLEFRGGSAEIWQGIATHGKPIQYAHVQNPLALWDVWTSIAAVPAAFEPPSAGFVLDWQTVQALREKGVGLATLTHAAGISSTGDPLLDAQLPLPEPYFISPHTAQAIADAHDCGGRVIAIGTTVVRALEHAARVGPLLAGAGIATLLIGPASRMRVVDAIVSGTHEAGSSHYELLGAFAKPESLAQADREMSTRDYLTHEFGDFVFIERKQHEQADTVLEWVCAECA
jgi:S-adenosylmethionine:tRNA ribosyltransferase-isomerase